MSQHDLGIVIGIIAVSIIVICGVSVVFASMRSSQISQQQRERTGEDE